MSFGAKRPLAMAEPVAEKVRMALEPYCEAIEIAGSIRRRRPMIGDIELVAIPKVDVQSDLFGHPADLLNRLAVYLDELAEAGHIEKVGDSLGRPAWGERLRRFGLTTAQGHTYKVEVFVCEPETWGSTLLIRTGSADFSKWMVTPRLKAGAMPNHLQHVGNTVLDKRTDKAIPLYSEDDFFKLCELPFIPAEYRQGDDWRAWLSSIRQAREETLPGE